MTASSFARSELLTNWYARAARKLPWRETIEPYRIWISEIMLQQTQVATVLPRYQAWFARFPTIESLAAAPLDDVLKAWEGLGYYRRARLLHQSAGIIMEHHSGIFPHEIADILRLPGIGRSTAGAIASICFGSRTPVLDGNVKRVLRRWHATPEAGDRLLWTWAQQAMDAADAPGCWNQAMMELGATICTPRKPTCGNCPVAQACASAHDVHSSRRPGTKAHKIRDLHWRVHLHACPKRGLWLVRRPAGGIWGGLWSPPITELAQAPEKEPDHVHLLTHRRLHLYLHRMTNEPRDKGRWARNDAMPALPTGIRRLLAKKSLLSTKLDT